MKRKDKTNPATSINYRTIAAAAAARVSRALDQVAPGGSSRDTLGQTLVPSRASPAALAAAGSQSQPAAPASNYCACAVLLLRKLLISRSELWRSGSFLLMY